jgi:uncharacterized protein YjiS (DUF1127 family)
MGSISMEKESIECSCFGFKFAAKPWKTLTVWLARGVDVFFLWRSRRHGRQLLGGMDDRMLRDIGVHRVEAEEEARKPFWRQ